MKGLTGRIITTICLIALFTSCMTTRQTNYLQAGKDIPQYADTVEYRDYQLQKGDYLYIRVFSVDPTESDMFNGITNNPGQILNTAGDNAAARLYLYLIDEEGNIDFPYVGKVQVLSKTLREVKFLMEDQFKDILQGYSVDVRLSNRYFSVIGESGAGRFPIQKEKLTIFQALAMSGDLSYYSDRTQIRLIRQSNDSTIIKTFDLRSASIINSEYYYIQPNDVLYIQFANAKYLGIKHFTAAVSTTLATVSFGMVVYNIVVRAKNAAAAAANQ